MEYRKLPRGDENIGVLGLGMGGIQNSSPKEIQSVIECAIQNGINFFDLCAGSKAVYEPFGKAICNKRDKVYLQLHFGAVYNENGEYGWSRDLSLIQRTFEWEMEKLGTNYIDFGFLHCIDEESDFQDIKDKGILDYVKQLKEKGIVRHIGFSSHTPSVANMVLDTGIIDIMMFSINPAYDLECGDEYGIGTTNERACLFRRCEKEGVGISVMKPFHGGQLLAANTSPFHQELTKNQCIQYSLDRPAVLTVVPGVRNLNDLYELLEYPFSSPGSRDYAIIGGFTPESAIGNCVYCNHCQPCPAGIDIGIINKYYDLSLAGDRMAHNHYDKLTVKADACIKCGHCDKRCPFQVKQQEKMANIKTYFHQNQ
ncbi:MAG: aldo/keto reductase [Prevotella sp.]|nr:aldo/keto reductase [Staphylococcus sp.]MCM1349997.1 aldo/keto reductase [Prevotella sp.]